MKLEATLYDVLELSPCASPLVVKAAYRSLAQSLHPDKHAGTAAAGQRLVALNGAYAVLSDPAQRLRYDRTLGLAVGRVERRGANDASGGRESGHFSARTLGSRPFGFRPFD